LVSLFLALSGTVIFIENAPTGDDEIFPSLLVGQGGLWWVGKMTVLSNRFSSIDGWMDDDDGRIWG